MATTIAQPPIPPFGYLLGSIPSALIVSCRVACVDICELGDGNMCPRNVSRSRGCKLAFVVAVMGLGKGALAVLIAQALGLDLGLQIPTESFAVLGHDFPLFVGFRGSQGLATTQGVLLVLAPAETLIGLTLYGALLLWTRNSDLSTGAGIGLLVILLWRLHRPPEMILASVLLILTLPTKTILDHPRRGRTQKPTVREGTSRPGQQGLLTRDEGNRRATPGNQRRL